MGVRQIIVLGQLLGRADLDGVNMAVLWRWFHRASGRIRGVGMYWLCHRDAEKFSGIQSHAVSVQGFSEAIIVSYALILLRL